MKNLLLLFIFTIATSSFLWSQACCSGGTPLSSNLGIQALDNGQLDFQLSYDFNTQKDLIAGSQRLDDRRRARNTHSILLRTSYAFSPKISLTGLLSYVSQEERITSNGSENVAVASGVGDAVAMLQYQFLQTQKISLIGAAGVNIPLGKTNVIDPRTGITEFHPDMQPGTGVWDGLFGANILVYDVFKRGLSFNTIFTYRHTTPRERFNGGQEYEFGNELIVLTGFSDTYFLGLWVVDPSILLRYRHTGLDKVNGIDASNTSGDWLHLMPGVDVHVTPKWSVGVTGEIPIWRNLEGTQLTTTYRFRLNLRYTIVPTVNL
ncbi:MAG: hypothetical protein AAFO07_08995 [Bacteroidota bacterium]